MMRPSDQPEDWKNFMARKPPFSVAIDGYVTDKPRFEPTGPYLNLDHHRNVDRLSTRSTCGQALMLIRQGLFGTFRKDGQPHMLVWANDCDEDVCLTWFLLKHGERFAQMRARRLDEFVALTDLLDTTAGMAPVQLNSRALREQAWVFEPYTRLREQGGLATRDEALFRGVIDQVGHRIEQHLAGRSLQKDIDGRYERLGGGSGWILATEYGAAAKMALVADGHQAFVLVRSQRPDDRWDYVIGRTSIFVPFDVPGLLLYLNKAEGSPSHGWGGADIIGGSPRSTGSVLSPPQVEQLVNQYLTMS